MKSQQVFKEIDSSGLSPAVLMGQASSFSHVKKYVEGKADNPLFLRSLTVEDAKDLASSLQLEGNVHDYVVVLSAGVTEKAWGVLLKHLEDLSPNTRLWFLGTETPRAIRTRCFSCYVPSSDPERSWSTKDEFLAASWLIAVDERSRERLLKSQEGWTSLHNEILLSKVDDILDPTTPRELDLIHTPDSLLNSVLISIGNNKDKPTAAFAVGLKLLTK